MGVFSLRDFVTVFVLISESILLRLGECRQQSFIANTNFDNPDRWSDAEHVYPCAGDRIIFPSDKTISVFVQTGATISEMILPMNGEFIFDDGVEWGVSAELSSCSHVDHSHDVHFSSESDAWHNPENWESSTSDGTLLGPQDILDIEKIPCDFDDANFPSSNSFTVEIEWDTALRSLRVADKGYDTASFADYRRADGRYQFIGSGSATIDSRGCQDQSGCLCKDQMNLETVFTTICSYTECKKILCENPILAYGSCCPMCGGTIVFNYTAQYTEIAMTEFLASYVSKPENSGIHTALSKINSRMLVPEVRRQLDDRHTTYDDILDNNRPAIQVLITDESGTGDEAKRATEEIYDSIAANDNLGVSNIKMQSSGITLSSGLTAGAIAGIAIGSIFGVIFLLILLYGIRSGPLRGKKYKMDFQLDDGRSDTHGFATITEVGPGAEFESSDDKPNIPKGSRYSMEAQTIGWPQRSAMDSDFGVSFGNPAYDADEV